MTFTIIITNLFYCGEERIALFLDNCYCRLARRVTEVCLYSRVTRQTIPAEEMQVQFGLSELEMFQLRKDGKI